jgi:hypothetical protein
MGDNRGSRHGLFDDVLNFPSICALVDEIIFGLFETVLNFPADKSPKLDFCGFRDG